MILNQNIGCFFPAYCQQLEDMIDEKIENLATLRAKAKTFRETLNDEEAKSRLLQKHFKN